VGEWVREGRREHTIDGAIAIDRVHGAPCGSGAFVPLASCCSLASFFRCVVLEIGCGGVSFGVLRIAVDMARPDEPLACHVSGLVVARFVEHHHRCGRGRCGCGRRRRRRRRCVGGRWGWWVIVVYGGGGKKKVGIVGHAKLSVGVCRRPF
jgi:hypothetical protein